MLSHARGTSDSWRMLSSFYRPSTVSHLSHLLAATLHVEGCADVTQPGPRHTDETCKHCNRADVTQPGQGGCYRENGREEHRFPSCYKREGELASNVLGTNISYCPFCQLPLSAKKRAGFCSSIVESGVPGRNCRRRQKAALTAAKAQCAVPQIPLLDYRALQSLLHFFPNWTNQ